MEFKSHTTVNGKYVSGDIINNKFNFGVNSILGINNNKVSLATIGMINVGITESQLKLMISELQQIKQKMIEESYVSEDIKEESK